MSFRDFWAGRERPPTWGEREAQRQLQEAGIADVLLEPEETPQPFWETAVQAAEGFVAGPNSSVWPRWEQEMRWATGWPELRYDYQGINGFRAIVRNGRVVFDDKEASWLPVSARLSAIEHLLDIAGEDAEDFVERVNDRARWFRVGLRIEGRRFVPVTQEHLHTEIVQPTLLLLGDPGLADVDALYRKAFNRALGNDASGAITAATSAVEEMLRLGLGVKSGTLDQLVGKATKADWVTGPVGAIITKLMALRDESDAHQAGTSDFEVAMFAVHLAGAILLHLSKSRPPGGA